MKNTNSFERGQDPIKSLGIGLVNILVEEIEKAPPLFAPNKIVKYFPKTQYVKVIFSSIAVSSLYHLYIQDLAKTPKYRDLIRYVHETADIVTPKLGQGERVDRWNWRRQPCAIRPPHQIGIEYWVMRQHDNTVFGDGHVGLERRHADFERSGEPSKRILGRKAARTTVTLQVKSSSGTASHCCHQKS